MRSPFPGMDPYLEQNGRWAGFHVRLNVHIAEALQQLVAPNYYIEIDKNTYLSIFPDVDELIGRPDVLITSSPTAIATQPVQASLMQAEPHIATLPMREEVAVRYLEVRERKTQEVVTVIEILSPANKRGAGRKKYEKKRNKILRSSTNLVEIDLLRRGEPLGVAWHGNKIESDYRIIVSRARFRPQTHIYTFDLQDHIPDIPIPLRPYEDEPYLPLNQLLHQVYERGYYANIIDYTAELIPKLNAEDSVWVHTLLR